MITSNYNNKNQLGFSALHYDKNSLARMPKQFQNAFNKALPELKKRSAHFDSELEICLNGNSIDFAKLNVKKSKLIGIGSKISGVLLGHSIRGYLNIKNANSKQILKAFEESSTDASYRLRKNFSKIIKEIFPTKNNRNEARNVRREINNLTTKVN